MWSGTNLPTFRWNVGCWLHFQGSIVFVSVLSFLCVTVTEFVSLYTVPYPYTANSELFF